MSKVTVEFFTARDGKSPISEFLKHCVARQETKILRQLQYVQEFGLTPAVPNVKKLAGTPLWELRILGKDNIRLLCVAVGKMGKSRVVVVHIFVKKKRKTPRKEIEVALQRCQRGVDK